MPSSAKGQSAEESITRFISRKLKLKVNETKSGVIQPGYSKYLGFGLPDSLAKPLAATRKGAWHISANGYLARALSTRYFTRTLGLVQLG